MNSRLIAVAISAHSKFNRSKFKIDITDQSCKVDELLFVLSSCEVAISLKLANEQPTKLSTTTNN